ncbi:MAG: hypothetical protein K5853_06870, partial [Lachnospiraceae bacterium]|nr:hypothetical protein [Lachnospiraceae bacterium]
MNELAAELQTAADMPVSLTFGWDENTDANDIHRAQDPGFETTEERRSIQTTKLYGIARAFIHQLNELYS